MAHGGDFEERIENSGVLARDGARGGGYTRSFRAGGAQSSLDAVLADADELQRRTPIPVTLPASAAAASLPAMNTATGGIIQVGEALPPEKQSEVIDFARFLLARQDDERWEQLLAAPQTRPVAAFIPAWKSANGVSSTSPAVAISR